MLAALRLLESDSDDDLITIITNYKKKPKKNPISRISIRNYENVVALYNSEGIIIVLFTLDIYCYILPFFSFQKSL